MKILVVEDTYPSRSDPKPPVGRRLRGRFGRERQRGPGDLRNQPIDLIISDVLMPQMDGFQLCREVKTIRREHIPFVVYTSTYTSAEDEAFARSLGADAFLVKPADAATFLRRIRALIARGGISTGHPPAGPVAPGTGVCQGIQCPAR